VTYDWFSKNEETVGETVRSHQRTSGVGFTGVFYYRLYLWTLMNAKDLIDKAVEEVLPSMKGACCAGCSDTNCSGITDGKQVHVLILSAFRQALESFGRQAQEAVMGKQDYPIRSLKDFKVYIEKVIWQDGYNSAITDQQTARDRFWGDNGKGVWRKL